MPDLTGQTLGRYELLGPIGHGGMAAVYKGRDHESGRLVAVKVLSPQVAENPQFLQRFRREARVVKQLDHPHIVPVEDFGEEGDTAYLVMPYLRVGSLADRLAQGPLTPAEGGRVMAEMTSALEYAHQRGVVHRDVKPSNILLDEDGRALLADFGLAQIHDASISLTGSALLGTPAYVSPEQVRGEPVDARSDQYSLGIVLYQLTTGQLPYEAETPMAVLLKQVNEPMPRPRQVNSNIPEAVERVILKATAKDPKDRFESMQALNAAFQAALAHALNPREHPAPVIALPPSAALPKPPARRRVPSWPIAAVLLLLLACPAGWMAYTVAQQTPAAASAADGSGPQLTAAAETIAALSTEIVAARTGPISDLDVAAAAAATATAAAPIDSTSTLTGTAEPAGITSLPATGTASSTPTSPPSNTPPGPSWTPTKTPSLTPSPTPTSTKPISIETIVVITALPIDPTPTPMPEPTDTPQALACDTSQLVGASIDEDEVAIGLRNNGDSYVRVTRIYLDWPTLNGALKKIELGSDTIWSQGDSLPPTLVNSDWEDPLRAVGAGRTEPLIFSFERDALPTGYSLAVELNGECQLTKSA
ncbi:MAG TPA: serine/threonine-protein kinase [Anaerolineales bacterium]|nr:serine/threonine-protein kinase [Anaerolineales bacterium]